MQEFAATRPSCQRPRSMAWRALVEHARKLARGLASFDRTRTFLRRNAYLSLVIAATLVLTQTIEFRAPSQVRSDERKLAELVGDVPRQEFSRDLPNSQAVQLRTTLRMYPDPELPVSSPDPEIDAYARILAQPVVTTILGMNAAMEQSVRLEGGELEIEVMFEATPRLAPHARSNSSPPMLIEHMLVVRSKRQRWWSTRSMTRTHLDVRGTLYFAEPHRVVFSVDDHLFSLDLELDRTMGT